ncbi:uncharacterized protein LOC142776738 isoform X3 [Rhipicephalus microplus]|uniref:uncharacterized protein LOC142776738 isoform X3 n=1 Tax=Rhipicephalus microplus TaxID=6941 RepID=UPI003F6A84C5
MPLPFTKQLSLANIMAHLEASEKRVRCLIEGEEVLNAGHRICCGVKACNIDAVAIQGLCLQTSHVREKPHELELVFDVNSRIKDHCSCKAGNAERCKHMIAMLLHVNRFHGLDTAQMVVFSRIPILQFCWKSRALYWEKLQLLPNLLRKRSLPT